MAALTAGTPISRIGQIAVSVHDVQEATLFYRDILGLQFLFNAGAMAFFDCGGVRLMLTSDNSQSKVSNSIIYFAVSDIRATHDHLAEAGVKFEDEPHLIARMPDHELWMCFFRDSENNLLGLMAEVPNVS